MTSVEYDEVFSYFLGSIKDYQLALVGYSDATNIMTELLHKAAASSYTNHIFSSLSMDDDSMEISYELSLPKNDELDRYFVIDIMSRGMVLAWLEPQVKSKLLLNQMISGKEQNFYSQASHLKEVQAILEDARTELRKAIRDRGYIYNSYLEEL